MVAHDFKYNKVPLFLLENHGISMLRCLRYYKVPFFAGKNREYQYFDVCCPGTSSCASKPLLQRCNLVIPQCICQVSLGLKEVQMGSHDFEYNNPPLFGRKPRKYQYIDVCCPETSSCASKPLLLRCKLVIPQCMCQVSLGLKEVLMGVHDSKHYKVPLFARKNREYQYFDVYCPETSSCASKPLLLRCNLVILQCICQVSLGLKEVQNRGP